MRRWKRTSQTFQKWRKPTDAFISPPEQQPRPSPSITENGSDQNFGKRVLSGVFFVVVVPDCDFSDFLVLGERLSRRLALCARISGFSTSHDMSALERRSRRSSSDNFTPKCSKFNSEKLRLGKKRKKKEIQKVCPQRETWCFVAVDFQGSSQTPYKILMFPVVMPAHDYCPYSYIFFNPFVIFFVEILQKLV